MDGTQLRRLVNKAAKTYAARYRLPHYLSLNRTEPTVLFFRYQDALVHGNFLDASYRAICSNQGWARRLRKSHPRKTALPVKRRAEAMELDSCTSSDALLMNVFCYPGVLSNATVTSRPYLSRLPFPSWTVNTATISFFATCWLHTTSAFGSGSSAMRGATTLSEQRVPSCPPCATLHCVPGATLSRGRRLPAVSLRHCSHSF